MKAGLPQHVARSILQKWKRGHRHQDMSKALNYSILSFIGDQHFLFDKIKRGCKRGDVTQAVEGVKAKIHEDTMCFSSQSQHEIKTDPMRFLIMNDQRMLFQRKQTFFIILRYS